VYAVRQPAMAIWVTAPDPVIAPDPTRDVCCDRAARNRRVLVLPEAQYRGKEAGGRAWGVHL